MKKLYGLKPERVMYYFEELTKIPRCSFDEVKISNYLLGLGRRFGLEAIQDEYLNVIIKKPASKGYKGDRTVIIQGHMDMVCEKRDGSTHDFKKDAINMSIENDMIVAKDTTLGADNGIAVAMALAILESETIEHPNLEILFTATEEAGMGGAIGLSCEKVKGDILINIDSEEEGVFFVSCAGGERHTIEIPINKMKPSLDLGYEIIVTGLKGGHSGMEIDQERGNSNKLMARILYELREEISFELAYIEGGSKSNAIPRYSKSLVLISNKDKFDNIIHSLKRDIAIELNAKDKDVSIIINELDTNIETVMDKKSRDSLIDGLILIPDGVQSMSEDIKGLVESSNNLGVIKTLNNVIIIESAIRSSIGSLKNKISNEIKTIARLIGAKSIINSSYPAWEYREESYIRDLFISEYEEKTGKNAKIGAIHAGLECGIFDEKFKNLDMISFGPNIYGVHAPGESIDIKSVERTYRLLVSVLGKIK